MLSKQTREESSAIYASHQRVVHTGQPGGGVGGGGLSAMCDRCREPPHSGFSITSEFAIAAQSINDVSFNVQLSFINRSGGPGRGIGRMSEIAGGRLAPTGKGL